MKHLDEQQLIDLYYGSDDSNLGGHLRECDHCSEQFAELKRSLDAYNDYKVPDRSDSYAADVWHRIAPKLRLEKRHLWSWAPWILAPTFAALLVVAFFLGRLTNKPGNTPAQPTSSAADRVLLMAMSDHLERSQVMLTELTHASPEDADALEQNRALARNLIDDNRLLRQSAWRAGDRKDAVLLDDLERVLLDVANAPAQSSARLSEQTLRTIQDRIDDSGLLFKVRVTALDTKKQGQRL